MTNTNSEVAQGFMARTDEIQRATLDLQAADAIRKKIFNGDIAAGSRLTETALAETYALSRGTIRAALRKLVSEGLLVQVPYTGWEVAPLSSKDAWELSTLRSTLEALAASLAARNISEQGRVRLTRAMSKLTAASAGGDVKKAAEADFQLHMEIIRMSGHSRLEEQYELIGRQVQRYIITSDALLNDQSELVKQHTPMVDAILAGDERKAAELARSHNEKEGEALVNHLIEAEQSSVI